MIPLLWIVQVCLAGRVAEAVVMGSAHVSTLGSADIMLAHSMVRVMLFSTGWSEMLGPVTIMDTNEGMSSSVTQGMLADMTPAMAAGGYAEFETRIRAAEAKAYFGIVTNWGLLQALTEALQAETSGILTLCAARSAACACAHARLHNPGPVACLASTVL